MNLNFDNELQFNTNWDPDKPVVTGLSPNRIVHYDEGERFWDILPSVIEHALLEGVINPDARFHFNAPTVQEFIDFSKILNKRFKLTFGGDILKGSGTPLNLIIYEVTITLPETFIKHYGRSTAIRILKQNYPFLAGDSNDRSFRLYIID